MLETGIPKSIWRGEKMREKLVGQFDKEKDKFMDKPDTKFQPSLDQKLPETKRFRFADKVSDFGLNDMISDKKFRFGNVDNHMLLGEQLPEDRPFKFSTGIKGVNDHFDSMAPPNIDYRYTDPQFYEYKLKGMTQQKIAETNWRVQGDSITNPDDLDGYARAVAYAEEYRKSRQARNSVPETVFQFVPGSVERSSSRSQPSSAKTSPDTNIINADSNNLEKTKLFENHFKKRNQKASQIQSAYRKSKEAGTIQINKALRKESHKAEAIQALTEGTVNDVIEKEVKRASKTPNQKKRHSESQQKHLDLKQKSEQVKLNTQNNSRKKYFTHWKDIIAHQKGKTPRSDDDDEISFKVKGQTPSTNDSTKTVDFQTAKKGESPRGSKLTPEQMTEVKLIVKDNNQIFTDPDAKLGKKVSQQIRNATGLVYISTTKAARVLKEFGIKTSKSLTNKQNISDNDFMFAEANEKHPSLPSTASKKLNFENV